MVKKSGKSISGTRLARERDQRFGVVTLRDTILSYHVATFAFVNDLICISGAFYADRFHHSPTCFSAITGMHVDMLAPQAFRTMIGIAIADDFRLAVFTFEILLFSLKSLTEHYLIVTEAVFKTIVPSRVTHRSVNTMVDGVLPSLVKYVVPSFPFPIFELSPANI